MTIPIEQLKKISCFFQFGVKGNEEPDSEKKRGMSTALPVSGKDKGRFIDDFKPPVE